MQHPGLERGRASGSGHLRKTSLSLVLLLASIAAHADNDFADCLLDNLQGVQNDPAAYSIIQLCLKRYPSGFTGIEKRVGWFAKYSSGAECTAARAKTAGGAIAPQRIRGVCYALYEPLPDAPPGFKPFTGTLDTEKSNTSK